MGGMGGGVLGDRLMPAAPRRSARKCEGKDDALLTDDLFPDPSQ